MIINIISYYATLPACQHWYLHVNTATDDTNDDDAEILYTNLDYNSEISKVALLKNVISLIYSTTYWLWPWGLWKINCIG